MKFVVNGFLGPLFISWGFASGGFVPPPTGFADFYFSEFWAGIDFSFNYWGIEGTPPPPPIPSVIPFVDPRGATIVS